VLTWLRFVVGTGNTDDPKPKIFDGPHHPNELIQIHRLRDIAVGVQVVTLEDILFVL
jgi:hypothetical protein